MDAFDLGVFDEAHKTAGREGAKFGFALEDRNLPIAKRVFLTATPRHYDVRKKDKEGEKALVYSMDEPRTYGPMVHTLSFAEAARRGIICNYKIIISVVTSEMVNADLLSKGEVIVEGDVVRARTVANQIAIQKACEEHDLRRSFRFIGAWHRHVTSLAIRRVPSRPICPITRPTTSMARCGRLVVKRDAGFSGGRPRHHVECAVSDRRRGCSRGRCRGVLVSAQEQGGHRSSGWSRHAEA